MTKLVADTKKLAQVLEILGVSTDTVNRVIIKLDRGKQITDSGDCYILESDRKESQD